MQKIGLGVVNEFRYVGRAGMKVVVVGRFPPPIGGVSVFVERKYASLRSDGAEKIDLGNFLWPLKMLVARVSGGRVFYLNTGNVYFLLACYFLGSIGSAYIYDHNASRRNWGRGFREWIFVFLVKRALGVRVVHEHLRAGYELRGLAGKVAVESPFIPPDETRRDAVYATYDLEVRQFVEGEGFYKIGLSASKYVLDEEGRDVYGIKTLVKTLKYLRGFPYPFKCFLAIAEYSEDALDAALRDSLLDLQKTGHLVFIGKQLDFWPIYHGLDLFLRLTTTDGDSVSVREALYFGCGVLASDVVPRPDGVVVYRYGDQDLLNQTVLKMVKGAL